jgi:hypothetical protein
VNVTARRPCSPRCRIGNPIGRELGDPEHGGSCDPRPERERARALYALLDTGVPERGLAERMDAEAREAWGPS